jgi:membrane-bound acyltransferase YfiQ involved in biofilm formation
LIYALNRLTGLVDGRFLEYLFIFTAGIYCARNAKALGWFFSTHIAFVLIVALIGVFLFWFVQAMKYQFVSWQYFLSVDIFILSWVLLTLRVLRSGIANWGIWRPISYASFFAYLYHRPIWELVTNFQWGILSRDIVWVRLLPGSIIVLFVCFFLQRAYDGLIRVFRLAS